jgi:hypothetical protein
MELFHVGRKFGAREMLMAGIFLGFMLALITDMVLTFTGA